MQKTTILLRRPLDALDKLLDGLTSYRLVLYFLMILAGWALLISTRHKVPYSWQAIAASAAVLVATCRASGEFFSRVLNVARNSESDYITALILALIMSPSTSSQGLAVLAGAGFAAIASKYLLTISRRHIFNPAAFGAVVAGVFLGSYASWWVGTAAMAPLVLAGGLLIMLKMRRFWLLAAFGFVYLALLHQKFDGAAPFHLVWMNLSGTAVMFFAFIMLTEPITSPNAPLNYLVYAVVVAALYSLNQLHVSPEEALLIGGGLTWLLERGKTLELKLVRTQREASGIFSFAFAYPAAFNYKAGQYMEWTLPARSSDGRGNRRYLTLSSSPSENLLSFAIKVPPKASHFKQTLASFKPGDKILASHLSGSFTLPANQQKKLAFLAGGIGITPFRSIAKYLIDTGQTRDARLLYCVNSKDELAYSDLFDQAQAHGLKTVYLETASSPIGQAEITQAVPDFKDRLFYVSGPYGFVKAARSALLALGVSPHRIKSDYFPGYN